MTNSTLYCALMLLALTACETSYYWYENHPEKKTVTIDGSEISVVPRGSNKFDAWGGHTGTNNNAAEQKNREIRGIEKATGCKVLSAEYESARLQSIVSCTN